MALITYIVTASNADPRFVRAPNEEQAIRLLQDYTAVPLKAARARVATDEDLSFFPFKQISVPLQLPWFPEYVVLEAEDWQGIYRDGVCVWQHHPRCSLDDLDNATQYMGVKTPEIHFYTGMEEVCDGQFPEKLDDIDPESFVGVKPYIFGNTL